MGSKCYSSEIHAVREGHHAQFRIPHKSLLEFRDVTLAFVLWAIGFLVAGLVGVAVLSLRRRPKPLESWLFVTLVLLLVGIVSLGVTGSAVAFLLTPVLNLIGFPSVALHDSWLGAMALSFLCPPGLVVAHLFAQLRKTYWLVFALSFFVYCLLMSIIVYFIVERV